MEIIEIIDFIAAFEGRDAYLLMAVMLWVGFITASAMTIAIRIGNYIRKKIEI